METKLKILNRHRRGDGIRTISRDMNLSRNTVRSVLRHDGSQTASYKRRIQPYPALGEHLETLEKLLRDNKTAKPKRTIRQLFEELQTLGYTGSESSVGRYVSKWKQQDQALPPSACVPLSFGLGEAYQFDWSTEKLLIVNEVVSVKAAHFTLCYSRRKFIYVYHNETQEMVFDAHIRAFEFFGGTPTRGIYDNMPTAVSKVLCGKDRKWNPNFLRLCAHYRVEPTACNPGCGNEKGQVERQVQALRKQFFTPMPTVNNLSDLNDIIASRLANYNATHNHPEYKDKTLDEVFAEEYHCFVKVPLAFDGCKETNLKVSTTCLARFDRNSYSVHCSCSGKIVQCKAYADKVVFIHEGKEVGIHERKFTKGQTYYDPMHYLPLLKRKPGALRNGAPFAEMTLPDELNKVRQHLEQQANGARDFAHILSYIPVESMESVVSACTEAIKTKTISKDVILNILLRSNDIKDDTPDTDIIYLKLNHIPKADCNAYNSLLSGVSA